MLIWAATAALLLPSRPVVAIHQHELEPRVKLAVVMCTATRETCNRAADPAHARKIPAAIRAAINEPHRKRARGERQLMAARFVSDAEIGAGLAPFWSMRLDPAATGANLSQQMRQLVSQSAVDFRLSMLANSWVQRD